MSVGRVIIKSFEMFITEKTSRIAKIAISDVIKFKIIKQFWLKNKTISTKIAPVMPDITLFDTFHSPPKRLMRLKYSLVALSNSLSEKSGHRTSVQ